MLLSINEMSIFARISSKALEKIASTSSPGILEFLAPHVTDVGEFFHKKRKTRHSQRGGEVQREIGELTSSYYLPRIPHPALFQLAGERVQLTYQLPV